MVFQELKKIFSKDCSGYKICITIIATTSMKVKYNYSWTLSSRNWWRLLPCWLFCYKNWYNQFFTWLQRSWSISIVEQISSENGWNCILIISENLAHVILICENLIWWILWKLLYKNSSEDGGLSQNISIRTCDYSWHKARVISLLLSIDI